jgi:hypothetical protein
MTRGCESNQSGPEWLPWTNCIQAGGEGPNDGRSHEGAIFKWVDLYPLISCRLRVTRSRILNCLRTVHIEDGWGCVMRRLIAQLARVGKRVASDQVQVGS